MPYFSVIIPVYNRPDLLKVAVESVLLQRMTDFELIIVDDGSSEDLAAYLEPYGDQLRFLRQKNAGQAAARNFGVTEATGEYLAFLDSDDVWLPWTLEAFGRSLISYGSPSLLLGTRRYFSDDLEISDIAEGELRSVAFDDFLALQRSAYTPAGAGTMVVRREVYLEVGGFDRVRCNAEDVDLYLRLGIAPGCIRLDSPVTLACRKHDCNVSRDLERSIEGFTYLLRREDENAYPGGSSRRADRLSILMFQARTLSLRLADAGRLSEAINVYVRAFSSHLQLRRLKYLAFAPIEILRRWYHFSGSDDGS